MKKTLACLLLLVFSTISYAQTTSYVAGFSHTSEIITKDIKDREAEINKVYDFSMLEKSFMLPPLVSILSRDATSITYKIVTPARSYCVNNDLNNCIPLKASDYLYKGLIVSEVDETVVDLKSEDYMKGEKDATNIASNNLAVLLKEYIAMSFYKQLTEVAGFTSYD